MIVDGHRLEVQTFGARTTHAPIVLLHEGLGSVSQWRDFPEQLATRTGRFVAAYSRYGYGRSDVFAEPRTPNYMHREAEIVLPALLAGLELARPVLFGHSDGASIALIFASKYPGACAALVLEAPHVFVEPVTIASIARVKEVAATSDLIEKLGRHHADGARTFWGWNDIWLDPVFRDWNIADGLASITAPVLAIQGNDDEYGTAAQIDAIRERVRNVETLFVDACGHSPHRIAPELVLDATMRFLSGRAR